MFSVVVCLCRWVVASICVALWFVCVGVLLPLSVLATCSVVVCLCRFFVASICEDDV